MNTKLQIINHRGNKTIISRQVAEMTDVRHSDLLEKIKGYIGYLTNGEFRSSDFFIESIYTDSKGEDRPCYLLTRKGCDMVANKMTGEKGVLFTAAYVTKFEEMENQVQSLPIPQTLPEALRAYADEVESHEKTKLLLVEAEPKVLFAKSVEASHTSILIGELAKILKQNGVDIGQNRLFEWMRQNGYLINRQGTDYNMPTQKSMELGLFVIKETTVNHSDGHISINKTPKLTGKGQVYFVNKFLEKKNKDGD